MATARKPRTSAPARNRRNAPARASTAGDSKATAPAEKADTSNTEPEAPAPDAASVPEEGSAAIAPATAEPESHSDPTSDPNDDSDLDDDEPEDDDGDAAPEPQAIRSTTFRLLYERPQYVVQHVESTEGPPQRLAFSHDDRLIGPVKLAANICDSWAASPCPAPASPSAFGRQMCNIAESTLYASWLAWAPEGRTGRWSGMTRYRVGYVATATTPAVILGHAKVGDVAESMDDAKALAEAFVELAEQEHEAQSDTGPED